MEKSLARSAYMRTKDVRAQPFGLDKVISANFRLAMLEACGWNQVQAAYELGMSLRGLQVFMRKMQAMGLAIPTAERSAHGRHLGDEEQRVFLRWATEINMMEKLCKTNSTGHALAVKRGFKHEKAG